MERCGEIIETNTTRFVAESFTLHQPPPLGALVQVQPDEGGTIFGVVSFGSTGGLDPGRRVVRRSTDETFDHAIYEHHPQLVKTLRTEFGVILAGYEDASGRMRQHIPTQPPPLHYSVLICTPDTVKLFSEHFNYFRLLLNTQGDLPSEQLLAAHIRHVYATRGNDRAWLTQAVREVATLLKAEYDRLLSVLYEVEP